MVVAGKCTLPGVGSVCEQYNCRELATCATRVSGFAVYACGNHHICDLKKVIRNWRPI